MNPINKIKYKLGYLFTELGYKHIQEAFQLNPKVFNYDEVSKFLLTFKTLDIALIDRKYWVETIDTWKDILEGWWGKERAWIEDRYDCDNHAQYFQAWTSWYFDLNTAGRIFGGALKLDGTPLENHYWNAILTKDQYDKLHLYMLEPQNGLLMEYTGEQEFVLGNLRYKPTKCYFG